MSFYNQWAISLNVSLYVVQQVIAELADRQAAQLEEAQKLSKNTNLSESAKRKQIEKRRKALQKELEIVAKGIVDKCVSTMDDVRMVRSVIRLIL